MRYKLETGHGKATLLDRRRVMAKGLDIMDAERIVEALNDRHEADEALREYVVKSYYRTVPRYPEPDDHLG
jgi:hypothetical protein